MVSHLALLLLPIAAGAPEVCNGVDDDGDGQIDEAPLAWGADADADGTGDRTEITLTRTCDRIVRGHAPDVSDCDDANAAVRDGATEVCNGVDDDCDGLIDEGELCDCGVFEDQLSAWMACEEPLPWLDAARDCAESGYHLASIEDAAMQKALDAELNVLGVDHWIGYTDSAIEGLFVWVDDTPPGFENFGKGEPNNGGKNEDQHCVELDRLTGEWDDDTCEEAQAYLCESECAAIVWYADRDEDGFGNAEATLVSCAQPADFVANDLDCDDIDAQLPYVAFLDEDADGYAGTAVAVCEGPVGTLEDCDDADDTSYPGATEIEGDGIDQDCDGESWLAGDGIPTPPEVAYGFGCGCQAQGAAPPMVLACLLGWLARRRDTYSV